MEIKEILQKCDHTLLDRCAKKEDIFALIDDGIKFGVASVCIPPCYVKEAAAYAAGRVKICTVIGFPNGYSSKEVKVYEAKVAVRDGADEVDTVINTCHLKDKRCGEILEELKEIKGAIGDKILKVIIETCLLTEEEKIKMCEIVSKSGADFIKTSTGFSSGGATREDIALMSKHIEKDVKIKAAGGIASLKDAEDFIKLGADRLGTSKVVKLAKNENVNVGY